MQTGKSRFALRPRQQRKVSEQQRWHRAAPLMSEHRALKPVTSAPVARSCTRSTPSRPALATRIPSGETASPLIPRFAAWMVSAGARAAAPFFPESRPSPAAGTCGPRGTSAIRSAFMLQRVAPGSASCGAHDSPESMHPHTLPSCTLFPRLHPRLHPSKGRREHVPRQVDRLQAPSATAGGSSARPSRAVKHSRPNLALCRCFVSCLHRAP